MPPGMNAKIATDVMAVDYSGGDVDLSDCIGFVIVTAGALKVDTLGGTTITFASGALAPNVAHPIAIKKVYQTGSTAVVIALKG